ncbi:MAG: hypothetical protein HKN23_12020 [Verrucomicrobiales bacterium]|nr:hypothetical protein [Verrucomicrobiales bacterium]
MSATSVPRLILKPTFPLDQNEIERRCRAERISHPITWGSILGAAILPWLATDGVFPALFGMMVCFGFAALGISIFWSGKQQEITSKVVEEMISESNAEQDRRLSKIVAQYRGRGMHHYATALGKFLLLKQNIEKRLHPGGQVTEMSEQIERLVDSLCANVCREFDKVAELDRQLGDVLISGEKARLESLQSDRTEVLEAIMQAYGTIYETLDSVVDFDDTGELVPELKSGEPNPETGLTDAVSSLKKEIEMAKRIRDRLHIPDADAEDADFQAFETDRKLDAGQ